MSDAYMKFTELFSKLSPYELSHLSEVMLCRIENCFESKLCSERNAAVLTEKELKAALIQAMRDIAVQLRQREIDDRQIRLTQAKATMFTTDTAAA